MISRLLRNHLCLSYFSTAPYRKLGKAVVADLPNVQYPTKPKPQEEELYSMNLVYQTMNYIRKDKLPNCRYFALQYNNRIYRFYNAYYYPLGRMIDRVATQIRGRTSPHYKNNAFNPQNGDICVIVNIQDPLVTGKKLLFKKLRYHTGFIGHLREYSYRHVLNHKPELLYHFLLNKVMPKNKLSKKYFDNLVLCRGPTHNFAQFPQFAPDKKRYSILPQIDFMEMMEKDKTLKVVEESEPGLAEQLFKRKPERYVSQRDRQQQYRERQEALQDINTVHQDAPKYKSVPTITKKEYNVLKGKEKKIQQRYRTVRAPYKKVTKKQQNQNLKIFTSEKKARKDPNYELLSNQQLQEIDEENSIPNPLVMGGAVRDNNQTK